MTTWINITELLEWRGNLTGIQRIEYNLAKLYLDSNQNTRFFVYKEGNHQFKEVEFAPDDVVTLGVANRRPTSTQNHGYLNKLLLATHKVSRRAKKTKRGLITPFSEGDTVLVIGSIWVGGFADDLVEAKNIYKFKLVHFAFDMIPAISPGFFVDWLPGVFVNYHKLIFSHADVILCISKSTAKDVRWFLQEHSIQNKLTIKVIRIGENIEVKDEKAVKSLEPGFLLSVSTIESRKNHVALFYMLQEAKRRGIELPKIVIVGRNGWHTEDFRYMLEHDPIARDGMMVINDADDATLSWLYHNCLFTIFPSFYEGWGMPVAESLAYGKLCLSSDTSSMPEIAGDLIDYFSPYDTGEMLDVITKYLEPRTLSSQEKRIKEEYTPTSWHDTYKAVSDIVDEV